MRWLALLRWPRPLNGVIALAALAGALLVADALCYQAALPVEVDTSGGVATLHVGSEAVPLGPVAALSAVQLAPRDSVLHEYQIDDTDSTNNFTLDTAYLHTLAPSPYYRFQAWMRDLDGTSRWRDLRVWADGHLATVIVWPADGQLVALPRARAVRVAVQLQRPETPMTLDLIGADGTTLSVELDRNDRFISMTRSGPSASGAQPPAHVFFPTDALPFAAMVADGLVRTLFWAVLALLAVMAADGGVALAATIWPRAGGALGPASARLTRAATADAQIWRPAVPSWAVPRLLASAGQGVRGAWRRLTQALHPVALAALGASFLFVGWIARVQYHGEPHVYDASAYFFGAKMFAAGRLAAPLPPAPDRFPGPFMVQHGGQWFPQYPPGTALTLAAGIRLGAPWLVEPVLGTLALLGIGLVAARLYDRRVATLAVMLGTLSPFYGYLAASYLSHAVALFFLVWGLWALVRFAQGGSGWHLPLAAALFGMASLTREQVAVLWAALVVVGVLALGWRRLGKEWERWILPGASFVAVALGFVSLTWRYNASLTGDPLVSPRTLFFAGDHFGFGVGVGFYGQHTLAAGLVNLDELLTSLQIDLFGWPFYLTLALLTVPFLARRAVGADWLMLVGAAIVTGAFVGYFYHGIYLGPRYLYETLPFLLVLAARGILTLGAVGLAAGRIVAEWLRSRAAGPTGASAPALPQVSVSPATVALVAGLVACNLVYFLPRQIAVHQDFSGLPLGRLIDLEALYHPPVHHALVMTDDYQVYGYVLFPLNDPLLHGDVIYAVGSGPEQVAELRAAFPDRALYQLVVGPDGAPHYTALGA
jgi:hypothetical protein